MEELNKATFAQVPLIDWYRQLEDVFIGLVSPFNEIKKPLFLQKGVAKVASLKQAAAVGGISVEELGVPFGDGA